MRALSQSELLALWESGRALHPLDRGLLALNAVDPSRHGDAADWPIGRRNRALAQLRTAFFGPALRGWTECPQCREQLEFEWDARGVNDDASCECGEPIRLRGRAFRLPTSRDLAQVATEPDPRTAAIRLMEQCSLDPRAGAEEQESSEWTEADIDALGEQMALADPRAEVALHFDCPACGASFDERLDLAAFVWAEIEGQAKRLLLDVHTLASAYGWSEAEIVSLAPARREFYIAMVRA
jgi:hypothetical protein